MGTTREVSKVVGINTTVVIAIVFFVGAVYAAMGGILSGHDTAIQPRMGLLLLLKGWIASVVGGIGNLYGAILGGFVLGLIEQFGIWGPGGRVEGRDFLRASDSLPVVLAEGHSAEKVANEHGLELVTPPFLRQARDRL